MHCYRETYCQTVFCAYFVYALITCECFCFSFVVACTLWLTFVPLRDVIMSSNLSGFVYKFGPVDQFLCSLFKKQRRRFLPVKLCTINVNIFHYSDFFCKC